VIIIPKKVWVEASRPVKHKNEHPVNQIIS
jgi:hypothetical protein